jgi:pimeloyl-ACP methyl ester carboxylesterase
MYFIGGVPGYNRASEQLSCVQAAALNPFGGTEMRQLLSFLALAALLALGAPALAQKSAPQWVPPAPAAPGVKPAQPTPAAPDAKSAQAAPATTVITCPPHPLDGRTIVFVANGAGGGDTLTSNLRQASADMHARLKVIHVSWSRYGTLKEDLADNAGQLRAARRLADRFNCLRSECPHSRFVFVGYSAGSRVVLAAAEQLPPGSLDRIVLLGSSVSSYYDLQCALAASCGGIDNFYSRDDSVLDMVRSMYGPTGGGKGPLAGLSGFRYPPGMICPDYCNLRQYRWTSKYGGDGDHYYWVNCTFLANTLVPLLQTPGCPTATVTTAPSHPPAAAATPPTPTHSEPPVTGSR